MPAPMNRREAVKAASLLVGGALVASSGALAGCTAEPQSAQPAAQQALNADDQALIEAIADTMLPDTAASPGARAAGAGAAINLLLTDCYPVAAREKARAALAAIRTQCEASGCRSGFASLPPADREALLRMIDAAAQQAGPTHGFHLVRELSLRAYFSSEIGMTRALRYVRVPGRWTGCIPLAPGQPAWG